MPKLSKTTNEPAVECSNVVKQFYHYTHRTTSLREFFIRTVLRRPIHIRRAQFTLRNFSLRVEHGEAIAMIGHNGSGKSTALRLIAGIYEPSEGVIKTHGSLASVIELGAGFNPELTGSENVALYGAVMGLTRHELSERFQEIADFAEVGDFIHEPVKYYSSGMYARLAFAVTVCIDPDILLLDEVLAVGDKDFRERCLKRLHQFRDKGGTLILVSHDLELVQMMCSRAIWMEAGNVRMDGRIHEVIDAYCANVN